MTKSDWSHYKLWHGIWGGAKRVATWPPIAEFPNGAKFEGEFAPPANWTLFTPHKRLWREGE